MITKKHKLYVRHKTRPTPGLTTHICQLRICIGAVHCVGFYFNRFQISDFLGMLNRINFNLQLLSIKI